MKAAIYTRYGPPEVVSIAEIPIPQPKKDEILIRVHAGTVNRTDTGFRSAQYVVSRLFSGLLTPRIQVLGCEFAGEVAEVGTDIRNFRVGDRVFGYDDNKFGGHAEYKVIKERAAVAHIPEGWDFDRAAALTEGSHYAWCNIRASKVKEGDRALVYGATGAIGSAAVQLLNYLDVHVTAVANTKNIGLVRSLGADQVIDYQTEDFTQIGQQFDYIMDAVGKSSFGQCKPLLKPKGIYSSTELGKNSENIGLALTTPLLRGKRVIFPVPLMRNDDLFLLRDLATRGLFKPVIDREYPIGEIVEAHRYVESGQKTGNVIIRLT